ncbi:hypothetical protein, partial [Brucella anthropi]|uniref:hypothetical protein n=1 Tax=Brucella anthropi TaxID=529 RepID=UPI001AEDA601
TISIVFPTVRLRPHRFHASSNQINCMESQATQIIQLLCGPTLKTIPAFNHSRQIEEVGDTIRFSRKVD